VARGSSACRAFTTGYRFDLKNHYRSDLNQSYLLTAISQVATQGGDYTSGSTVGDSQFSYSNSFECIPFSTPFRPPRVTPAPIVQGCQTAVVVGPAGEEIFTDKYGRVKVQFHWDREGKRNENSSCWIRVSHPWAGKSWGAVSIPRIGQEVIVDFLEGDPDQPIIVGRVYNAGQMPPYGLPGSAVISGVKSNSTKGGGGYNEIILDDTKGNELIRVHGQKDREKKIEHDERSNIGNDRTEEVGRDETIRIKHDKYEIVNHDRTLQVDHDKTETVVHSKTINVGGDHSEKVAGAMAITVGTTLTETVLINYAESVGGAMELTVGGALAITAGGLMAETVAGVKTEAIGGGKTQAIGGAKSVTVGKDLTETVSGARTAKIMKDMMETVSGQHREEVTKEYMLQAKKIQLTADEEIHVKTGSAEIIMKKNGDITVKGNKININGSSDVIIKGSKIKAN